MMNDMTVDTRPADFSTPTQTRSVWLLFCVLGTRTAAEGRANGPQSTSHSRPHLPQEGFLNRNGREVGKGARANEEDSEI